MKKTLLCLLLILGFLMVLGICAAYAETGISVTGVAISNGYGTDVNHDKATADLSGNIITVSGVLDDMSSYASADPSQGSGKWVGILISTNQASITSLYYSSDGTNYSQLTLSDSGEAVQMGATDSSTFILWIKADVVKVADKTIYLASDAMGTGVVSYTVKFVDQANVITSGLTNITSSNTASKVAKNAAYSTTLSAASGYSLPAAIIVTVGGSSLTSGVDYTYTQSTGSLSIPVDKVTGTLAISGAGVTTPKLSSLTLASNSETYLSSGFSANTYTYYPAIDEDETYLYLTPGFNSAAADLEVTYAAGTVTDYLSAYGYYRIAVDTDYLGDILVKLTSKTDTTVSTTYTLDLSVAEESWDVDMKIKGDDDETYLTTGEFTPDDSSYSLDLDDEIEELSLYVYFDDDDYKVTVKYDGSTVSKDDYTSSYYLYKFEVDTDDLGKLTVKVADIDNSSDYITYTFTLDGSSSGSDALEDIHLNTGTSYKTTSSYGVDLYPGFDSDITDYVALIPYDDDYDDAVDLYLRLTLEDDDVDLVYEGSDVPLSSDYYNDTLSVDAGDYDVINFTVEDVDYTITVYYADENADDDAYLDNLTVRSKHTTSSSYDLDLSPNFDEDETEYSLDAGDYNILYVYPDADSDMIVLVEGEYLTSDYWSFDPDDYDEITVTVFAENLEDYEEYTIDLNGSSNSLTSLSVYSGTYSSVKLSPSFNSSVYNYVGSVGNGVSSVTLKFSSTSTVKIAKDSGTYATKSSGAVYSLNEGLNEFDIQVGSTHYYLNIYRESATLTIAPSTQYISINGGSKIAIPAFNINGNNFVKLRAVAYLLSGTGKQFSVNYADASKLITLRSGYGYASVGGELTIPTSYTKAVASSQTLYLNSSYVYPTAYNIDGYNYFLLRDLAALFDFQIKYSGNTVYIYTDKTYGGGSSSSSSSSSDFEIDMKLMGDSDTYLSKSEFDPDDNSYDVEISEDEETLDLYIYFDSDDYTVKVKYDGTTVGKDSSTSSYYVYGIDVDTDDLDEITVTVTNDDGDNEVYTIYLEVE